MSEQQPPRAFKRPAKRVRIASVPSAVVTVASRPAAAAAAAAAAAEESAPPSRENEDDAASVASTDDAVDVDDEGKRERKSPSSSPSLAPAVPLPVTQLTLEARARRTREDNAFLEYIDPIVAKIPLVVPPPAPGFADHRDVLKRAFRSDNGARDAVFDYMCRVARTVYPSFNDVEAGQDDNRHAAAMTALHTLSPPFQAPLIKDHFIIDSIAAFYNITSFRHALEAQCDVAEFTRFVRTLWARSQSAQRGLDVADFGKRRVKNATPTFGYDPYTYVVKMRNAYGGALSPLVVPSPQGSGPRSVAAPTAPVPSLSNAAAR